ncbi:type II secretion system F family protein [Gilvimarinus sp. SDUM040013]|uniref:Type II secretion system F family protein n=1 Tax=Gilvimarinus gilvus TaxID=3058038 RepID=A0ABU4RSS3_9GAMM|nr:type II secretion system F family protein [Gilvimarinus sp. SDUM040013]MDO3388377.1 type II secretion system F family protein [Gilvimarinus sp. SDUM040013]MDX6847927.1 type II secretion system F family protein [Gilvimarinus sp. SDUM040013]
MATTTATKQKAKAKTKVSVSETFLYKVKDRKGNISKGEASGSSAAIVRAQLQKQGYFVQNVRKKPKPLFGSGNKKVAPSDIAVFARQMATMMKAGVPLVQSFDIVAGGADHKGLEELIIKIRDDVASGTGFAPALRNHPRHFDDLFCNLVEAGEQSGALETMLARIATYKEKTEALKSKIKKALTYPIAVVIVALVVTAILLIKVVPQFAETFSSFGADLPAFTLFVLGLSELAQTYWLYGLAGAIGLFFAFKELKLRSPKFAYAVDRYMLKMPIVGDILYQSIMARFARTLSTTFAAGVPLIDALTSVAGAAGNLLYRDAILRVREEVSTGVQLNMSIRNQNMFPSLLIQMASIGEESGALDDMLDKAASYYEEEVDNKVDSLSSLLEPMIMSVLGVLVGGLMIAMYLPIFQIGQVI